MVNKMVKIRINDIVYEVVDDVLEEEYIKDMVLKAVHFINLIDEDFLPVDKERSLFQILEEVYDFKLQEYEENEDIIEF